MSKIDGNFLQIGMQSLALMAPALLNRDLALPCAVLGSSILSRVITNESMPRTAFVALSFFGLLVLKKFTNKINFSLKTITAISIYNFGIQYSPFLIPYVQMSISLDKWIATKPKENYEDRQEAKKRILKCYWNNNTNLYLQNLNLTTLPDCIGNLSNLTYMTVRYNRLSSLPDSIGSLPNLTHLNLACNEFTKMPDNIPTRLKECVILEYRR